MASPVGSLELPESLLEVLRGNRGEDGITRISDLPSVVLGVILSRIPNPIDVASALVSSRLFWSISKSVPFRFRLRPSRYQDGFSGGEDTTTSYRGGYDARKVMAWTRAALTGISADMLSTQELDLAGCPVLDDDVVQILADLHSLDCLVLDGCQKLTSSVTRALALSVRSGPRIISLQRCFGLGPSAAGNLLAAAAARGSRLRTILLSHLDRVEITQEPLNLSTVKDINSQKENCNIPSALKSRSIVSVGIGLRVLALHNCGHVGHDELLAITDGFPHVEALLLGGSGGGLGLSRPDVLTLEKLTTAASSLVKAVEALSRLRILEVTFFTSAVLQLVRDQTSKNVHIWDLCDKHSVTTAASVVAALRKGVQQFFHPFASGNSINTASGHDRPSEGSKSPHSSQVTIRAQNDFRNSQSSEVIEGRDLFTEGVLMALRASTNCSDARLQTPLHIAAALGEPGMVANLLRIGAATGMKDSQGATALFLAAESGHGQVCDHLLRGRADVLASTRSGETPLYIAALRGHSTAVEVMLSHCLEHGINWQAADVYGDGWTPLMAATLADRQDVGKLLLSAAGASVSSNLAVEEPTSRKAKDSLDHPELKESSETSVRQDKSDAKRLDIFSGGPALQILDAQNRYKQTALHIAARRGSLWFVSNLLLAGASVDVKDEYGLLAVDVARKFQNSAVEKLLRTRKHALGVKG